MADNSIEYDILKIFPISKLPACVAVFNLVLPRKLCLISRIYRGFLVQHSEFYWALSR